MSNVRMQWKRNSFEKIRTSPGAERLVDQVANRAARNVRASYVLPNANRRGRAGATVGTWVKGHSGRMELLRAIGGS